MSDSLVERLRALAEAYEPCGSEPETCTCKSAKLLREAADQIEADAERLRLSGKDIDRMLVALAAIVSIESRDPDGISDTWRDIAGQCIRIAENALMSSIQKCSTR